MSLEPEQHRDEHKRGRHDNHDNYWLDDNAKWFCMAARSFEWSGHGLQRADCDDRHGVHSSLCFVRPEDNKGECVFAVQRSAMHGRIGNSIRSVMSRRIFV
jgi:hypothetical protein